MMRQSRPILPHRTSGTQPFVTAAQTPVGASAGAAAAPVRRAPAENVLTLRQRRHIESYDGQLVGPTITGDDAALVLHIGPARLAVPSGTRVAQGAPGIIYALVGGRLHILIESGARVMELAVDDDLAAQIAHEAFDL